MKVRDGKPWEGAHPSRTICGRFARRLVINAPAGQKNFCTTTLVLRYLVLQTHWDTQGACVTFRGTDWELPHGRMKHDLTLDQVKKEAINLLRGLERRDPEALRRYRAVDPVTDISKPALDDARFIIAREHGFSSWRKLKEHIDNLGR